MVEFEASATKCRFFLRKNVKLSPQAGPALACALCCLHSWELLAPLSFDSRGSDKMPYFLAASLFKNKNGFTEALAFLRLHPLQLTRPTRASNPFPESSSNPFPESSSKTDCFAFTTPAELGHHGAALTWTSVQIKGPIPLHHCRPAVGQGDGAKAHSRSCPPLLATF